MLEIAISTSPQVGQRWTLMKQCGVECAVGGIGLRPKPDAEPDEQPWSYTSLASAKAAYEAGGIPLAVIESRPPMEKIKLGLPGRDEEIEVVCELLQNMGKLEIPVWCYAWMPILGVIRTSRSIFSRGGAQVSVDLTTRRFSRKPIWLSVPYEILTVSRLMSSRQRWRWLQKSNSGIASSIFWSAWSRWRKKPVSNWPCIRMIRRFHLFVASLGL